MPTRVKRSEYAIAVGDELTALLAKTERGCFVGASPTPQPRYRWVVNGR